MKEAIEDAIEKLEADRRVLAFSVYEEIKFMEAQLARLRKLPFIKVHPQNPERQQQTEAARQYSKLNSAYIQSVKLLLGILGKSAEVDDDSLLAKWLKNATEVNIRNGTNA